MTAFKLVGHRGLPARYPENSVLGCEQAIRAGADAIEVDVQFSADGVPFMLHDADFSRLSSAETLSALPALPAQLEYTQPIAELSAAAVKKISVHEPTRFGQRFNPCYCSPLAAIVPLLQKYPTIKAFIEIKPESFGLHDRRDCVDAILTVLAAVLEQAVIISFDAETLVCVRRRSSLSIGWVVRIYDTPSQQLANDLLPDYLICNHKKIRHNCGWQALWPGPWQWFIYDVIDPELALQMQGLGAQWIESWDVACLR